VCNNIVAVAFQSAFNFKMHQNNIFFIFKKIFLISTYQNYQKNIKKINFKQIKFQILPNLYMKRNGQ
jgi:hypothetical protein